MTAARFAVGYCALALAASAVAFLHHGHIEMFLTDVRERLIRKGARRLREAVIDQQSSRLALRFPGISARYEVAIRRLTRSLEIALYLEGSPDENARLNRRLAERSDEIRAALGPRVQLEAISKHEMRLAETQAISHADWSPKRDLTSALAEETATRLLRFIHVLNPTLKSRRRH